MGDAVRQALAESVCRVPGVTIPDALQPLAERTGMPKRIKLSDFGDLALMLKPTLTTHGVPEEQHYSIISDAVFEFANFIDETRLRASLLVQV